MSPHGKFLLENCFIGIGGQLYMSFTMIGYFCTDKRKQMEICKLARALGVRLVSHREYWNYL